MVADLVVLAVSETTVGIATAAAASGDDNEVAAVTELLSVDCAALLIDSMEL